MDSMHVLAAAAGVTAALITIGVVVRIRARRRVTYPGMARWFRRRRHRIAAPHSYSKEGS